MKSFIISICILISIGIYITVTSLYFLDVEQHIIPLLGELERIGIPDNKEKAIMLTDLKALCSYLERKNKVLSLYIHRSKCTEAELLLKEVTVYFESGNAELCRFTALKLREAFRDIRENDALLTLNGIL